MIARKSSGSSRADKAVEPTRSQNITVSWRRSAVFSRGPTSGAIGALICSAVGALVPNALMAFNNRLRGPSGMPIFSRSPSVSSGNTSSSISFSRNTDSYRCNPKRCSHALISTGFLPPAQGCSPFLNVDLDATPMTPPQEVFRFSARKRNRVVPGSANPAPVATVVHERVHSGSLVDTEAA
jgi:hypothetical protein